MTLIRSPAGRPRPFGVLDVGTSKVCCLIGVVEGGVPVLCGLGHHRSSGLKSGMVVAADEAERTVRAAVGQAERMAGISLDEVTLAVGSGRLRSASFTARAPVEGGVVRDGDVGRILDGGEAYLDRTGRAVVQLMRTDWQLDGVGGIADPRGLAGRELAVALTAVTADDGPVRNLIGVVERGHLAASRLVAGAYASALAVASEEERQLGVAVIELGAGLTSIAVLAEGRLVHLDSVPVGGHHVTYDIARELVTSVAEAERIKTLYGTLVKAPSNAGDVFAYPVSGDDHDGQQHETSKAHVAEIARRRIDGLMELVDERLRSAGLGADLVRRMVLTGGASQLVGLEQAWCERFGAPVRLGRPAPLGRMPASMCSPAFATVIGLAAIESQPDTDVAGGFGGTRRARGGGYLDRMQRWIRESF